MAFRENLVYQRTKAGLSQQELAGRLRVRQRTVDTMEVGTMSPSTNTIMQLTRVFGCAISDLICERDG